MTADRGKLKVYLGYAAGVGKTYQMLEEAQRLKAAGADVVIGYFEPHGRADTIAKTEGLETIPRKKINYRGTVFEEMDTGAILSRHPKVAVVDEFPHTNVPGLEREKRWQDVDALLAAGIDVLTTMNIQHLESLNDQVFQITGVQVRETLPDWMLESADEVVMIDVTPRALLNRLERGVVYSRDKAERALQNFFRESTLVGLRELALRQTAHEVELRDLPAHAFEAAHGFAAPQRRQRILVYVTDDPATAMVLRRAKRVADFLRADCFAVAVHKPGSAMEPDATEHHLNFARNLHIETRVIESEHAAEALVEFARRNEITQIFAAKPRRQSWHPLARDIVQRIVALAKDMQIVIVADRRAVPSVR
jgi:two-component system sensor histidine kinase KdpD